MQQLLVYRRFDLTSTASDLRPSEDCARIPAGACTGTAVCETMDMRENFLEVRILTAVREFMN